LDLQGAALASHILRRQNQVQKPRYGKAEARQYKKHQHLFAEPNKDIKKDIKRGQNVETA